MATARREAQDPRLEADGGVVTVSEGLRGVQRLALDASALVDYIEEAPQTIAVYKRLFERAKSLGIVQVGSALLYAEMMVVARTVTRQADAERLYREALGQLEMVNITASVSDLAAEFRMTYRLQTADALHLACAVSSGCDAFLTSDGDFVRAQGIPIGPGGQALKILHSRGLTP